MKTHLQPTELVALSTRIGYLQLLRLAFITLAALFALTVGEQARVGLLTLAGGYLAVVAVAEAYWRGSDRRGLALLNALLVADGLFLAWLAFDTGGTVGPFRYLILVHAGSVALLASYRTGMKVTLWHSLLLAAIHRAQMTGVISPTLGDGAEADFPQLVAFVAALWFMAVGTATFSAVNERELRRRRYDLEALTRLTGELDRVRDPRDVADTLLTHVRDTFEMGRGVVIATPQDEPRLLAAQPSGPDYSGVLDASRMVRLACEKRRAVLVRGLDDEGDPALLGLLPGAGSLLIAPMIAEGRAVGAVVLEPASTSRRIQRRLASMVQHFCAHGALALQNAWLVERLQVAATTDGLTGLANRRTFESTMHEELSRSARDGSHVSLALIDIDHFKQVNDVHGHQAGDDVLREVAQLLRDRCRGFDTAARYGGEEFAVVLPRSDADSARDIAQRLRREIEEASTTIRVTVSIGVTTAPPGWQEVGPMIAAADAALYASKDEGRNRVTARALGPEDGATHAVGAGDLRPGLEHLDTLGFSLDDDPAMTLAGRGQ